jgi:hypothetical protein
VRLDEGRTRGHTTTLDLGPSNLVSRFSRGDHVRVQPVAAPEGSQGAPEYQFAGLDHHSSRNAEIVLLEVGAPDAGGLLDGGRHDANPHGRLCTSRP